MKKQRKHYPPEEKVNILRRHLLEEVPISEVCDKHGVQPKVFYRWQKEFFENVAAAGDPCREGPEVGGGAKTAADPSAAGCVKTEEAGLRQPKHRMRWFTSRVRFAPHPRPPSLRNATWA